MMGDWRDDGVGFEKVEDPARDLFALPEPWEALIDARSKPPVVERIVTLDHDVPVGHGRTLRLREHFNLGTWLHRPKRAILFLGSCFTRGDFWSIPVQGYNASEMAVNKGFFAFTCDYLGIGDSYRPDDGLESTFEANLAALEIVLRFIRFFRAIPAVDLVGESWGAVHACHLAADEARIRSCTMCTTTYKVPAKPEFLTPEFAAFLRSLPGHYLPMGPEFIDEITVGAPEEVKEHGRRTQPGSYLMTHFLQSIEGLPHFDPSVARARGLVISGSMDRPEDGRELALAYGSRGAEFFEIAGGGHGPRLERPDVARQFWNRTFDFIES